MSAINSTLRGWWKNVTIIIWGAPALLVSENATIQALGTKTRETGVHVSACRSCADQLRVTENLKKQTIEIKYWGEPITKLLKNDEKLLTI